MKWINTESSFYSNKQLELNRCRRVELNKPVSRSRPQRSNKVTFLSHMRIGNRECISAGCTWSFWPFWLRGAPSRARKGWGQRSARQARVSFSKNVLLPPPLLSPPNVRRSTERISWRGRERKSETNERRRTCDARRGERMVRRRKEERDWQQCNRGGRCRT